MELVNYVACAFEEGARPSRPAGSGLRLGSEGRPSGANALLAVASEESARMPCPAVVLALTSPKPRCCQPGLSMP